MSEQGAERGSNICFVYELDGIHVAHLGDVGHLLNQPQLGDFGQVDVVCVPIGGSLAATRAAELVAQLDAKMIVPMPLEGPGGESELDRFLHEMSVAKSEPQPKLTRDASRRFRRRRPSSSSTRAAALAARVDDPAPLDHGADEVRAQPIGQQRVRVGLPHDEVGVLALFE